MHAVRDVLRRALMTVYTLPQSPESAVVEHRAIRAAVAARDDEGARREMRSHLSRVETDVEGGSPRV
jgi:DNA-binding FadR family transcriptional regulator